MAKQRTEKIIACIFWVIGAALLITAMLTDFWISNGYLKFGLFEYCAGGACAKFEWLYDTESYVFLNVFIPRILLLGGAGFIALGLLIGSIGWCMDVSCPVQTEGILDILGGLTILLGCTIFTARNFDALNLATLVQTIIGERSIFLDGQHFHFSFYFGWVSGLIFIIAGVCSVIAASATYFLRDYVIYAAPLQHAMVKVVNAKSSSN